MPTQPAASEIRPLSSAESATFMPAALLSEHVLGRNSHAVESQLSGVLRAQAELALDRVRREAG